MLSTKYRKALEFAADLHAEHFRKGTEIHYLSHLLSVSALVMEHGGSEDEAIAGLLHDSIEDQGDDYASRFFGPPARGRD
ncbi:HD domain-containing protein, partial [Clostridium perfringens]|nr:HD domain-containing protein [Clostridium perfringens]